MRESARRDELVFIPQQTFLISCLFFHILFAILTAFYSTFLPFLHPFSPSLKIARDVLPKFVKELTRAEVEIGQSAKMEAKVIGTPSPEIKWYKDDIAIKTNERIRTKRADDGTLTVEIDNVTEEDLGLYKVLASNSAGEKITIAALRTPRHELPTKTRICCPSS